MFAARRGDQRTNPQRRLRRRNREPVMKVGLGLYRHMLTREYYDFACQAGCTHVVVHLVDYFKQGASNPRHNQPTGGKYEPWGLSGDPEKLWTVAELSKLRHEIEDAGLTLAAIENLDPAHWHDILLDGPRRFQHIENVKTIIRRMGEAGIPVLGYNFSLAGVCGRVTTASGRGGALTVGMDGSADDEPVPAGMIWNMIYIRRPRWLPYRRFLTRNSGVVGSDFWKMWSRSRSSPASAWRRIPTILPCLTCAASRDWCFNPTCISDCSTWFRAARMLWNYAWERSPK